MIYRRHYVSLGIVLITVCLTVSAEATRGKKNVITVSVTPPTTTGNSFYVGNKKPLTPSAFYKLPIGSIEPQGWLRRQLELMGKGMIGRLPEISPFCTWEDNAWADPNGSGSSKWEELPYWFRGYISLSYLLGDKEMISLSKKWIEAQLAGQREDGYFGPQANKDSHDIWPNMVMLYALRTYYEATGDSRIIEAMKKYFRWQANLPIEHFLPGRWQKVRGADNLDSIHWLYNHTGESWLLDLAKRTYEQTAAWPDEGEDWHGVNLCQRFRGPAQYYQQSHNERDLQTTLDRYAIIMDRYGQVPGGMFGADEEARLGYGDPRQAAETCSMTEMMHSDQLMLKITGQVTWADRCEDIAFNSLPASQTPDLKALHYLTSPNMIQLDRQNKAPMIYNKDDMFSFSPYEQYRCCQHNVAFGWPYYAEHLWLATAQNGLAAAIYSACTVTAKVGKPAMEIQIKEITDYPFDEQVVFKLKMPGSMVFPWTFRVPGWCESFRIRLNGMLLRVPTKPGEWVTINRMWENDDMIRVRMLMPIRVRTWTANSNSVSVDRGPLTYSLKIRQEWKRYSEPDQWACYEVFPTSPWNYALVLPESKPEKAITIDETRASDYPQPFTPYTAPIVLKAKGRKVTTWKQEDNGLVGLLPKSPVPADQLDPQTEDIKLIPMGCTRLRISAFPVAMENTK